MTKILIALLSVTALAACDTMPNRSASDSKTMPSTSRSDASVAPTAGTGAPVNGAAASGNAGNRNGDAGSTGEAGAPGATDVTPSGMAPK